MEDTGVQRHCQVQALVWSWMHPTNLGWYFAAIYIKAFQHTYLRRIWGPTFIDREHTNARTYACIQQQHGCTFESFGDTTGKKKVSSSRPHSPAMPISDPMVSFLERVWPPKPRLRPGRPRADWVVQTYRDATRLLFGPIWPLIFESSTSEQY